MSLSNAAAQSVISPSPVTRFVIYSHARSGSSMLQRALREHPAICAYGESLHPGTIQKHLPGYAPGMDPVPMIESHLFSPRRPEQQAVGFKFFPEHADRHTSLYPVWAWLKKQTSLHFICLYRENLLRYHVSNLIARLQGRWEAHTPDEVTRITVPVDPVAAVRDFEYRLRTRLWARMNLPQERVLELQYEQIAEDPQAFLRLAQLHLGVEVRDLPVTILRQELRQLPDIIENYDELVRRWRDTPWACFLE